ncbi:MAG: Na+/H+ antiporter NhaA, partial [Pedobacter sp.]
LLVCVATSLLLANSSAGQSFDHLLAKQIGFNSATLHLRYSVLLWINDGLMAIFFLLVGLEIKREALSGELASIKKAALPIVAALGGVIIPALVYALINQGTPTAKGWGIPMATDIAFALAIISLLGNQVPTSLKVFLSALAIVDDLSAIVVIAVFYSTSLNTLYLLYATGIIALLLALNQAGIRNLIFYLIPGLVLWYCIHHSGIHATIAGVLTAIMIPANLIKGHSPLEDLEHILARPVNFVIMPLFALVNTNILFEDGMVDGLTTPLGLGILLGLLIGKPLGITLFSFLSVKMGLTTLPSGAQWKHIIGIGILGGLGFTISIFVANLSFLQVELLSQSKFAILTGSIVAGIIGYITLRSFSRSQWERTMLNNIHKILLMP